MTKQIYVVHVVLSRYEVVPGQEDEPLAVEVLEESEAVGPDWYDTYDHAVTKWDRLTGPKCLEHKVDYDRAVELIEQMYQTRMENQRPGDAEVNLALERILHVLSYTS